MKNTVFTPLFVIDHKLQRYLRIIRPFRIDRILAIADHVARILFSAAAHDGFCYLLTYGLLIVAAAGGGVMTLGLGVVPRDKVVASNGLPVIPKVEMRVKQIKMLLPLVQRDESDYALEHRLAWNTLQFPTTTTIRHGPSVHPVRSAVPAIVIQRHERITPLVDAG